MRYRNRVTGFELETDCLIAGADWEAAEGEQKCPKGVCSPLHAEATSVVKKPAAKKAATKGSKEAAK